MNIKKVAHWIDFVRFITDKDLWSRWTLQVPMNTEGVGEQYFIEMWAAARDNRLMPGFDFSQTQVQVLWKDEDSPPPMEHEGEDLWYFFQKWANGERL